MMSAVIDKLVVLQQRGQQALMQWWSECGRGGGCWRGRFCFQNKSSQPLLNRIYRQMLSLIKIGLRLKLSITNQTKTGSPPHRSKWVGETDNV